tara:strand:- start:721 stop:1152 length:432 start_codon:yes stop_codon:yes gene_type:complete
MLNKQNENSGEGEISPINKNKCQVADLLPNLCDEDRVNAETPQALAWAEVCMEAGIGTVWNMPEYGVALQVASKECLRLLTVVNHSYCLWSSAMIAATLESLGLYLIMDENTVLADYEEGVTPVTGLPARKDSGDGEPGVEVV